MAALCARVEGRLGNPFRALGRVVQGSGLHPCWTLEALREVPEETGVCLAQDIPDQLLWHSELSVYEVARGQPAGVRSSGLAASAALEAISRPLGIFQKLSS
jgi:hypothetical protein